MKTSTNATQKNASYKAFTAITKYMTFAEKPATTTPATTPATTPDSLRAAAKEALAEAVKAYHGEKTVSCLDFDKVLSCMVRRVKQDIKVLNIASFRKLLREYNAIVTADVLYTAPKAPKASAKKVSKTARKAELYQKLDQLKEEASKGNIDLATYMQAQNELLDELKDL